MTSHDMVTWRAQMGYTQRQAADALGVTPATYQRMERGADWTTGRPVKIDRRTALACAALAAGIAPWGNETQPELRSPQEQT